MRFMSLMVVMCLVVISNAVGQNLLLNSSFEDGVVGQVPTGWKNGFALGSTVVLDDTVAHSGSKSVQCTVKLATTGKVEDRYAVISPLNFVSEINVTYNINLWAKGAKGDEVLLFWFLNPVIDEYGMEFGKGVRFHVTSEWKEYTATFTTITTNQVINLGACTANPVGSVIWLDDVTVTKRGSAAEMQLFYEGILASPLSTEILKKEARYYLVWNYEKVLKNYSRAISMLEPERGQNPGLATRIAVLYLADHRGELGINILNEFLVSLTGNGTPEGLEAFKHVLLTRSQIACATSEELCGRYKVSP